MNFPSRVLQGINQLIIRQTNDVSKIIIRWRAIIYNSFIDIIRMRSDSSQVHYRRKFYPQNLDNLFKIKQKRYNQTNNPISSVQTLPKFTRPYSESRLIPSRVASSSRQKSSSNQKMYNKLSTQLKEIKQSIATLSSQRRKKKPSKYKSKVITEVSEQDPKTKIYQQVLRQIKEIKDSTHNIGSTCTPSEKKPISQHLQVQDVEKTLFYGVDLIDGVQFKVKVKMGREKYCLMAKNNYAKLMMEMPAKEYLNLNNNIFHGNPCAIFKYLAIEGNRLKLKKIYGRGNSQEVKSFLGYY